MTQWYRIYLLTQEPQETQVQSLGQVQSPGGGNGNPLQYPCLENPMNRGASRITVRGAKTSLTQLSTRNHDTQGIHS